MKKTMLLLLLLTVCTVNAYSRDYFVATQGTGDECTRTNPCSADIKVLELNVNDRIFFQTHDKWLYDPTIKIYPKESLFDKIYYTLFPKKQGTEEDIKEFEEKTKEYIN
jgi:hypothetical protein